MKKRKKKYFPNNWRAIKETPSECFETDQPLLFDDFMEWKMEGWELAASHCCVIRETNTKTGKIKEHTYTCPKKANKKLLKLMDKEREFIIADRNQLTEMQPEWVKDDDDSTVQ